MSEFVAIDWDHSELATDLLPGGLQEGTKRDAYLDLESEIARRFDATETRRGNRPEQRISATVSSLRRLTRPLRT